MTTVAFPYDLAGCKFSVTAEFDNNGVASSIPDGAMISDLDGKWVLTEISVVSPDGEEASDDLHNIYIRPWGTKIFKSVLSDIEQRAFEEIAA